MKTLTGPEVTAMVCDYVQRKGGPEKVARSFNVTPDYIRYVMRGKRPGKLLYEAIGVREADKAWVVVK